MTNTILEIAGLETSFTRDKKETRILRGVDLTLEKGQIVGLVGESGSGKSITSLSILQLFHGTTAKITAGSIKYRGRELTRLKQSEIRRLRGKQIAMIFQEPMTSLNPVMKIGRQIIEPILLHMDISKNDARKRALEMLEKVGIARGAEVLNEYPHQLSGGMRQRVMIAMAMACEPDLLIADEPTTALDVTIQAQILDLMKQLKQSNDTAILLITHDLGVVAEMCDRIAVMYCGEVVEEGDVNDVFEAPKHPYTKGLISSIPVIGDRRQELPSIRGNVPSLAAMPAGCKFAPRCDLATAQCHAEQPPVFRFEDGSNCSCWLYSGGGEQDERAFATSEEPEEKLRDRVRVI